LAKPQPKYVAPQFGQTPFKVVIHFFPSLI